MTPHIHRALLISFFMQVQREPAPAIGLPSDRGESTEGASYNFHFGSPDVFLNASIDSFYFIFVGDPQIWYKCEPDNVQCISATGCTANANDPGQWTECARSQGEYSNGVVHKSIFELDKLLRNKTGQGIRAIVVNGDLVEAGSEDQLARYLELWHGLASELGIKIYPGLGNHDYFNTHRTDAPECPENPKEICAKRMLNWFTNYVAKSLKIPRKHFDFKFSTSGSKSIFSGSLAYWWLEQGGSVTNNKSPNQQGHDGIYFIQLNHHPAYADHIVSDEEDWIIEPSFDWLKSQLSKFHHSVPLVINFHDVETRFSAFNKKALIDCFSGYPKLNILAVFFAHNHPLVGLKEVHLINGRQVPFIYTGSVPSGNYLVVHFSSEGISQNIFRVHTETFNSSSIRRESLLA